MDGFRIPEIMARGQKRKPDEARVAAWVQRLEALRVDRSGFDIAVAEIEEDTELASADLIAIAHAYNKGGRRPASRAAALALIRKRFVENVRFHAKNKVAEKVRPW